MNKRNFVLLGLVLLFAATPLTYAAKEVTNNALVKSGITKYKSGNYLGCLQDMGQALKTDSSNVLAQYYVGMANVQLGRTGPAEAAYNNVIKLNTNKTLTAYAQMGLICTKDKDKCNAVETDVLEQDIKYIYGRNQFATQPVASKIRQVDLDVKKNTYNAEVYNYIKYDKQKTDNVNTNNKSHNSDPTDLEKKNLVSSAANSSEPTDEEIASAVRTLAKVGLNPLQMTGYTDNSYAMYQQNQSPEMMQMAAMLGGNNNNQQNDAMMMPYLMSLRQGQQNVNPEMIKTMMMSSMLGNMNAGLFTDDNQNRNY